MLKFAIIAVFGGIGSVLRYLLATWCQAKSGTTFPVGTLTVNLIGCVMIGFAGAFFTERLARDEHRLAVMVGLLGGFTTFSSYAWESLMLIDGREFARAAANFALSNGLGLLAVLFAYRVGVRLFGV
jgi:CrcB protein